MIFKTLSLMSMLSRPIIELVWCGGVLHWVGCMSEGFFIAFKLLTVVAGVPVKPPLWFANSPLGGKLLRAYLSLVWSG